jgi:hypothetical protein
MVVGAGIETEPAAGDQPQHGGGGDQRGDAGCREPVTGVQDLGAVQVRPALRSHPRRGIRAAPGQDQAGQAQLRGHLARYPGHLSRDIAECACRRCRHPAVGDPPAGGECLQPGEPVRWVSLHRREDLQAGDLNAGGQQGLADDDEVLAQVCGHAGDHRDQVTGRKLGQETLAEMLSQLLIIGGCPARRTGIPETGDHPSQLRQRVTVLRGPAAKLLESGPVRQAVLSCDGSLRVVQGREFASGQAAFRLELQVPQAGPIRQWT